jgi:hypothetical protein
MFAGVMSRVLLAGALICALVTLSFAASADDADSLIKQGVELRRARRDREALEQFRRAYDVAPTPRALAQMALAEQALERWVDAEVHLSRALAAGQDPWIAKYRSTLETSRTDIARHLGWLELGGDPAGAQVRVDGQPVGALPLPRTLRVLAGSVVVDVSASGHVPARRTLSITPGQVAHAEIVLAPARPTSAGVAPVAAPEPRDGPPRITLVDSSAPARPTTRLRRAAWISLGVTGGLALIGGAGYLVGELDARDYKNAKCSFPETPACEEAHVHGTRARKVGMVSLIGAGVAGLAAAALFVASRPAREPVTSVACLPDPSRFGASCALRF